jgi:Tfp pilus assembly protein FimT
VNKCNHKSGFTLFETLITACLASILLFIGFTQIDSEMRKQNLSNDVSLSTQAIIKARYYARTKGVYTSFSFIPGQSKYSIKADGNELTNNTSFDSTSGKLSENVKVITNSCSSAGFDAQGILKDSSENTIYSDCIITLGDTGGPQKKIYVRARTGYVEYE